MKLHERLRSNPATDAAIGINQWAEFFKFNGLNYPLGTMTNSTLGQKQPEIPQNFLGYVDQAFKASPLIFSCVNFRMQVFAQMSFKYRRMREGMPGGLFGTADLAPLEPSTAILARASQDVDLSGNAFFVRGPEPLHLRPDWVTLVWGSTKRPQAGLWDVDAKLLGYIYHPGGRGSGARAVQYDPDQVAHYMPIPDPTGPWGMSWIQPLVSEIQADQAMLTHKQQFFEQGAQPNLVVTIGGNLDPDEFKKWVELFEGKYSGPEGLKTMYFGEGSKAEALGADLKSVEFSAVQSGGEARITSAAGIQPLLVGLQPGLESATFSNAGQVRRLTADTTFRYLWESACEAFSTLVPVPSDAQLWYDEGDIPFLSPDVTETAEARGKDAETISKLFMAGFEADSIVEAVTSGDFSKLKHEGRASVQTLPNGKPTSPPVIPAPS
ncbi:MAG: phage portal protein [Solirubrobacterales bacterium]